MTVSSSVFFTDVANSATGATVKGGVQCFNPLAQSDWDAVLAGHPHGSFFQSAAWAAVLVETYGFTPHYFAIKEAGALRALLPLMEVDSWLTGRRGVALPFTDDCEPLCADAETARHLVANALALARARGWKQVEFRGGRKWFGEAPPSLSFYSHNLDLAPGEEALFAGLDSSVRRAIRKAEKEKVSVEFSDSLEAVRVFYNLLCRTRKKHGMPPQPFAFFRNIHRHVISKQLGTVVLGWHQGAPIAGAVFFQFGGRAIYKFGASDETQQQLRGNNLVMWEAIKRHAAMGCKSLNLGRTSLHNDGLRRFKLGWGAREEQTDYVKLEIRQERFLTDRDESSGWHNRVFNKMPIWLSKIVGAALYRHWA